MQRIIFEEFSHGKFPLYLERQEHQADSDNILHAHDYIELIYVIKGNGVNVINGKNYPIVKDDFYIIQAGNTHTFQTDKQLTIYNLMFQNKLFFGPELKEFRKIPDFNTLFTTYQEHQKLNKLSFYPPHSARIKETFARIHKEQQQKQPGSRLLIKTLFTELLFMICRIHSQQNYISISNNSTADILAGMINFIYTNYTQKISVTDIGKHCGISAGYAGELFKKKTGLSIVNYINKLKVDYARHLLEESELTIAEICHQCGFEDGSYFSKLFSKNTGMCPVTYRDHLKNLKIYWKRI